MKLVTWYPRRSPEHDNVHADVACGGFKDTISIAFSDSTGGLLAHVGGLTAKQARILAEHLIVAASRSFPID